MPRIPDIRIAAMNPACIDKTSSQSEGSIEREPVVHRRQMKVEVDVLRPIKPRRSSKLDPYLFLAADKRL
jgi:hypothetical protein